MPSRAIKVRGTVKGNNTSLSSIRVAAVTLSVANVVNAVPDVLVVALQAIGKVNVQSLRWTVAPRLVAGHAGVADGHHCPVASSRVGLAPTATAEAALGIDVGFVVDAV